MEAAHKSSLACSSGKHCKDLLALANNTVCGHCLGPNQLSLGISESRRLLATSSRAYLESSQNLLLRAESLEYIAISSRVFESTE
jgi:hypothetical protein